MDLESTEAMEERARGSPAVKDLSQTALRRVGEILVDPATDARVVLQAAKLALWAAGREDTEADGPLELRFTGGADGDF